MENLFGIDNNIVKSALTDGIKVKKDGQFINVPGFISLTYIIQYNRFVLAYGSGPSDAGFVYVDKFEDDWILK